MGKIVVSFLTIFTAVCLAQNKIVTPSEKAEQKSAQTAKSNRDLLALKIDKGAIVTVDAYDADSDTFEILIVKEPGVGPNVTTLEHLQKATAGTAMPKATSQKKSDLIGTEFTLQDDLVLLNEKEVAKRTEKK